jgi:hypothetical protein
MSGLCNHWPPYHADPDESERPLVLSGLSHLAAPCGPFENLLNPRNLFSLASQPPFIGNIALQ